MTNNKLIKKHGWPKMDKDTRRERGRYLVARSDTWNFDTYLAHVIVKGVQFMLDTETIEYSSKTLMNYKEVVDTFQMYILGNEKGRAFTEDERVQIKLAFETLSEEFMSLWT